MVPVVAVGFYALLVAGNISGEPLAAMAPVLWMEPELGERESLPLLVFRIALFVAPGFWLPLSYYRGQQPSWGLAVGVVLVAVVVHVCTCGMTAWAHRQFS